MANPLSGLFGLPKTGGRSRKNRRARSKRNSRRRRTLRGGGGDSRAGAQLESRRF